MTDFGRRYDLATLGGDLATPTYDLAAIFVARSFLGVANTFFWCVRSFNLP